MEYCVERNLQDEGRDSIDFFGEKWLLMEYGMKGVDRSKTSDHEAITIIKQQHKSCIRERQATEAINPVDISLPISPFSICLLFINLNLNSKPHHHTKPS